MAFVLITYCKQVTPISEKASSLIQSKQCNPTNHNFKTTLHFYNVQEEQITMYSNAPELVRTYILYSAIKHGYRYFIS